MKRTAPLSEKLRPWLEKPLAELPKGLRSQVRRCINAPWDDLSAAERGKAALDWDLEHDPAGQSAMQAGFDLVVEEERLAAEIARWRSLSTPTALDASLRDAKLKEFQTALARLRAQGDRLLGRRQRPRGSGNDAEAAGREPTRPAMGFIPYPRAMKRLADAWNAAPEELAAWVALGPEGGGVAAYLNANEIDPPPRFIYSAATAAEHDLRDYVAPLMGCWFKIADLDAFKPAKRFMTGKDLIARWAKVPGVRSKALIRAKIRESRLEDLHPLWGLTQGTMEDQAFPPLEEGLFDVEEVAAVEASDLGDVTGLLVRDPPVSPPEFSAAPAGSKRLAKRPDESPVERGLRLLARKRQLIKKGVKNFNLVIAGEEGIKRSRVKQILTRAAAKDTVQQTEKTKP